MAARDLTASMLAAIQAGNVRPALLYEGTFVNAGTGATEYLRLWTGVGTLSWDGKSWTGGGGLLSISAIGESSRVQAIGFEVSMSGQDTTKVSLALQSVRKNRDGKLWLALFDAAGAVIADPYLLKRGLFSQIPIRDDGGTATITAVYEDRLDALNIPRELRYTHESQQLRSPGDTGFKKVEALQDATFKLI